MNQKPVQISSVTHPKENWDMLRTHSAMHGRIDVFKHENILSAFVRHMELMQLKHLMSFKSTGKTVYQILMSEIPFFSQSFLSCKNWIEADERYTTLIMHETTEFIQTPLEFYSSIN